jgi:hypothetical protein
MSSERGDILQLRLDRGRKLVEGTWKQFQFKMITPEDYPRVFECLHKNFFNSTPLTKAFEYSKAYYDEFDKVYLEVLPQNLSFCAIDTNTNEVGLNLTERNINWDDNSSSLFVIYYRRLWQCELSSSTIDSWMRNLLEWVGRLSR